ncbi:hypothetical protein FPE01S_02_05260 [Flavihumibacter petaseus NBRC 106054]|uniref:TonB-dependent receptor n=2 Tax=Flavihumibacter TaxID=1004301 RepID=A0A0E9N1B0_9BACT|nr:hypothetical protein FPE01S_02_05260 [Flavihumibacter petaseus NBRC 106054]
MSGMGGGSKGQDSLKHRDNLEDSITIRFRFLDSSRMQKFDSSVVDFRSKYPLPANYTSLGNTGSAARAFAFHPLMNSGWDPGFHAFDIYKIRMDQVRFFQTTRPYSELGYLLGSRSEQIIHLMHTQNIKPNWNAAFQYDLINSPGFFKNQNVAHNRYLFNTHYQSKNKRYNLYFVLLANVMQANENGGIRDDQDYLDNVTTYKERSSIPVQLGNYVRPEQSFLNSKLNTGNRQSSTTFLLRQQYDLGKKDSVVTDSTVQKLFYPKLRMEYNVQYSLHKFKYYDAEPDDSFYVKHYNFLTALNNGFTLEEHWKDLVNDFSLYSFPDERNAQQFLKAGFSFQNLTGDFSDGRRTFYNMFLHGEYRNRTRNRKWDIQASGKFYLAGFNNGDFDFNASLQRFLSRKLGYASIGLQNVNRTPSYIYETSSSFSFGAMPTFNKENVTRIYGAVNNDEYRWRLAASYYLVSNFAYFKNYYVTDQASALFNVFNIEAEKTFRVGRRWHWMANVQINQRLGDGPVNMPLFFTFQRFGYEGNLGFKNLSFAAGLEGRYFSPYKADQYSPLQSQFFYQDTMQISMKFPDLTAYLHFRIRGFTLYLRAENLNTASFAGGSFGWTNNNLAAPYYPTPGFQLRLGIFWSFVN